MSSCHPFPHFPPRHTPPPMSSEVMHNLSTGADMSDIDPTITPDYQPHHVAADADHAPVAEPDDTNCERCGLAYPGFGNRHGFGIGDAPDTDGQCGHLSSHFLSYDDANGATTYGCDDCDSIWTEDDAN